MSLILRNVISKLQAVSIQAPRFCTAVTQESTQEIAPIISVKNYGDEERLYQKPRQAWLENMNTVQEKKLGLVSLHPDVFAVSPRIDIIQRNVAWQRMYRFVCYAHTKTRAELRGGGRKPWPQKGMGRARVGSIRSPLFVGGGRAHGPRSPTPHFYMLPYFVRVAGLTTTLSVKLAQDDLHIVDDLEIPTIESSYVKQLIDQRNWGPSVLFVDTEDTMPRNMTVATDTIKHVNMMPVYGLNVYSMLKHETLVLTERAVRRIEEKILYQLHRPNTVKLTERFKVNQK